MTDELETTTDVDVEDTDPEPMEPPPDPNAWRANLIKKDRGKGHKGHHRNVETYLLNHPAFKERLAYDEFSMQITWCKDAPWRGMGIKAGAQWTDDDTSRAIVAMNGDALDTSKDVVRDVVKLVAQRQSWHPIRQYLQSLEWDKTERLSTWLSTYLGAEDSEYTRAVARLWMLQCIQRVMEPGCPGKYCLTLEGPQNIGKSGALKILGGAHTLESELDIGSKESVMLMAGSWIIELPEGAILTRHSTEALKSFLGLRVDEIVPKYSNVKVAKPRQCSFAMTVNPDGGGYLSDQTGNVRFLIVKMTHVMFDELTRDRDQLWAEAHAAYMAGERPEIPEGVQEVFAEVAAEATKEDPWESSIARALTGTTETSISYVLREVLGVSEKAQEKRDSGRLGQVLTKLGFERSKRKEYFDGHRCYIWRREPEAAPQGVSMLPLSQAEQYAMDTLCGHGWQLTVHADGSRSLRQRETADVFCDLSNV